MGLQYDRLQMKSSGGCRGEGVSSLKGVLRSAAVACLALDPAASSPSRGSCKARSSCHWPSTAFLQPHTVPRTASQTGRPVLVSHGGAVPFSPAVRRQSILDRGLWTRLMAVDTDELERVSPAASPLPSHSPNNANRPLTEADKLTLKAEMLRLQAEKLRLEAEKEQLKMERDAMLKKQKRQQDADRLIAKLRENLNNEEELKHVLRNYLRSVDSEVFLRMRELGAAADSSDQALAYRTLADKCMDILKFLDEDRFKEVREEVQYRLRDQQVKDPVVTPAGDSQSTPAPFDEFSNIQNVMRNQSMLSIDQLTQEMMRNNTRGLATIYAINLPQWLPREFMRTLESFEPLLDEDVRVLRSEVFKQESFFVTDVDKTPLAVAYMGRLRKSATEAYKDAEKRLQAMEGLRDRVQLFLFENPRPQAQEPLAFGDEEPTEVLFMAVSTRVRPLPVGAGQATLSVLSLVATALNVLIFSILSFYTPQDIVTNLAQDPLARLNDALPIAAGVVGIQLAHDLAHFISAKAKDIQLGFPIYIPSLQIGTFGSILRFVTFPKNRKDMFDVALAGPLIGMLLSFGSYALGMALTQGAPADVSGQWPLLPVALFRSSLVLWQVGQALFSPDVVNLPLTANIHVHPLAVVGALGLLANALQSMPVGRLDGGRLTTSVFGRKAATFISASIVLYQVISGILLGNSLQLFWGTVVIIFQNALEMYAKDEITPVDGNRRYLLFALWILVAATLLPGVPWRDVGFDDAGSWFT